MRIKKLIVGSIVVCRFVLPALAFAADAAEQTEKCAAPLELVLPILTLVAILLGPLLAVYVTRWIDAKRLRETRQLDVFRTLMRTRRTRLNPDHVGALNLVEIEFQGETEVIGAWRNYLKHLSSYPKSPNEDELRKVLNEGDKLFARFLSATAKALHFGIEQLDLFESGYVPQGWEDEEGQARLTRAALVRLLRGESALPVVLTTGSNPDPFPPAPEP